MLCLVWLLFFFFFNDTAPTEISTLSLHDALPISARKAHLLRRLLGLAVVGRAPPRGQVRDQPLVHLALEPRLGGAQTEVHSADRKSTRLNSSHGYISYAGFCFKKKKV